MNHRTAFPFLYHSLSRTDQQRTIAFMHAIRRHAGRAWVMLDAPIRDMPPRIIGVRQ